MERVWVALGAIAGLTAVAMSAFIAHGTGALPAASVTALRDAVQMQGWHALALVATGLWAARGGWLAHLAGLAFAAGLLMFCGAVDAQMLADIHLGPLAPTGGITLMAGWLLLGLSALRR